MRRGKLISRGHRQLWLAHSVLARQPLVARLTKHQRLSQELGLPALSEHVAGASGRTSALPRRNINRQEQSYLPPNGIVFRPALIIQAGDGYATVATPGQDKGEEMVDKAEMVERRAEASSAPTSSRQMVNMSQPPEQVLSEPSTATAASASTVTVAEVLSEPEAAPILEEPRQVFVQPVPRADIETSVDVQGQEQGQALMNTDAPKSELTATNPLERREQVVGERVELGVTRAELASALVTPSSALAPRSALAPPISNLPSRSALAPHQHKEAPQGQHEEAAQSMRQESEPIRSEAPSEQKDADEHVQPLVESATPPVEIIKPRRPRRSIEELPAQSGRSLTPPSQSAPSTKEAQGTQRNVEGTKAHEKPSANAASKGTETTQADELFAPTNTDRSPQAWLARLMGKSLAASEPDTAAELNTAASSAENPPALSFASPETIQDGRDAVGTQFIAPVPTAPARRQSDIVGTPLAGVLGGGDGPTQPASVPDVGDGLTQPARVLREGLEAGMGYAGDHKGPPRPSQPPSPLRNQNQNRIQDQPAGETRANVAPDVSQARPQRAVPTPVSMQTRRFLQPLLGIDPASVRVHRDAEATRLTGAYRADAITVGDDVEVAVGHIDDTPETLGLLAHEFTHVARQREPNFVPPIMRSPGPASSSQPAFGQQSTFSSPITPIAPMSSTTTDEEALALQVERQVRRTALRRDDVQGRPQTQQTRSLSPTPKSGLVDASQPPAASRATNDPWSGLPAPWEPLPDWLASPSNAVESNAPVAPISSPVQPPQSTRRTDRSIVASESPPDFPPLAGVLGRGGTANAGVLGGGGSANVGLGGAGSASAGGGGSGYISASAGVQRAGKERPVGMGDEPVQLSSPSPANVSSAPEPDLDDLARQVYSRLKRRLEVERQRFS